MGMHYTLVCTADRHGYGGQQKGTICDARGLYIFDSMHTEASYSPNLIDSLCLRVT